MKPSILHICKVYLPVTGGIQKVVKKVTELLPNYAHTILTTGADGAIAKEKLRESTVLRCRSYADLASMPVAPSLFMTLASLARKHSLIAVHYPFPLADAALLLVPFAPPIVVHWHSDIVAQKRLRWLVAPFTLLMLARSKTIVVTSPLMVEPSFFLRLFSNKIRFIPYGLGDHPIPEQLGESNVDPYFLLVGRHVSYKGMEVAIQAIGKSNNNLVIAGDGPLFEQHEKLVQTLQLQKQITFVRHASDADIFSLIANCTALVVPSVRENEAFALVQLEAMRFSKPVVNTKLNSSVPWVARHNKEALTVEPSNIAELASVLNALAADSQLCSRLGENGLLRFNAEFSDVKFADSIASLYKDLVKS